MRISSGKVARFLGIGTSFLLALYAVFTVNVAVYNNPERRVLSASLYPIGSPMTDLGESPSGYISESTTQASSMVLTSNRDLEDTEFQQGGIFLPVKTFKFDKQFKNPCWYDDVGELRCLPYFFIVGVRKCATTQLWNYLSKHPDVLQNGEKENQLYGYKLRPESIAASIDTYVHAFDDVSKDMAQLAKSTPGYNRFVFGDGSTSPLYFNRLWMRNAGKEGIGKPKLLSYDIIHSFLPDSKIIILFRDPSERLYSEYYFVYGKVKLRTDLDPDRFHELVLHTIQQYNECFEYNTVRECVYSQANVEHQNRAEIELQLGIYYVYMEDLIRIYGRDQILVLHIEDLERTITIANVFNFLNLSSVPTEKLETIVNTRVINARQPEFADKGPMLNATRKILEDFYRPFNTRMATLMNDDYFLFKKEQPNAEDV